MLEQFIILLLIFWAIYQIYQHIFGNPSNEHCDKCLTKKKNK